MYNKLESLLDDFYKTYYKLEEINLNQIIKCLTANELHVIEAIGKDKITMNELSEKLGITMGTASVAVNKLTDKYFIERYRSEEDRRKVYVSLTKKGFLAYNHHGNYHSEILEKITKDISEEKLNTFIEVFNEIFENLNKVKEGAKPETIISFEVGDNIQVASFKGSTAIRKYLNDKGILLRSNIKIVHKNEKLITLLVNGDEKIISIEDAENILVRKTAI